METLLQNLRFSLRMLGRNPGLTITVLLTLALGIGANTAIFTVDYATLLAPLPYPEPNQLVMVWSKIQTYHNGVSAGDYTDWKNQSSVFSYLCAWTGTNFNVATKDQPEYLQARLTSPEMLQMMGEPLLLGRFFLPEEGVEGKNHVAILTHKFWVKLGANPHIVGTTIRLDGQPYTVVGVQRPGIFDKGQQELTVPLVFKPEQLNHDFHWLLVMGRLKPGITIKQAQQNMDSVTKHIAEAYPKSDKGWDSYVEPLKNDFLPKERIQMLWMLLGAVGFVLLIACVNVANLLLARGMTRQKELAVRSAMGAGRKTIFAQLLTESVLLALAGGALGVGVGYGMLQGLIAVMPRDTLPYEADLRLNIPILLFTLGATTLAGLLAGSVPAWYASRVDPAEALKEGGRTGTSVGKHRVRRILVVGEFTLALVLLAGSRPRDSQLLEFDAGGSGGEDGSRADVLFAGAGCAVEGSGADYELLSGNFGANLCGAGGFACECDDGDAVVRGGIWDAVHDCGWADVRGSVAAAGHGIRDGDAGLFFDVRGSPDEGARTERSGHGDEREGGGGE
jgi:putative ABC transport system permease protein